MSLSQALKEAKEAQRCQVCRWLEELSPEDQECFEQWLDSGLSRSALFRASKKQEPAVPVGLTAFKQHCRECQ